MGLKNNKTGAGYNNTMSRVVIFRARHAMIAMGLLMAAFLGNASASPNTITVQKARPVAEAIEELERRYGWQITYEDPPYVYYGDITEVTGINRRVPVQSQSELQAAQQPANQRTLVDIIARETQEQT
jgi:hypothetical protein